MTSPAVFTWSLHVRAFAIAWRVGANEVMEVDGVRVVLKCAAELAGVVGVGVDGRNKDDGLVRVCANVAAVALWDDFAFPGTVTTIS